MTNSATNVKAALYLRLSRDDDLAGDSSSILTQDVICKGDILPKILHHS